MEDKIMDVVNQYPMQVKRVYRSRGAFVLETDQGVRLLKVYEGTKTRAEYEYQLQSRLKERGQERLEEYIPNREGELLSSNSRGENYLLRRWYLGEDCDFHKEEDVIVAARNLAGLHQSMRALGVREGNERTQKDSLESLFDKRTREMKRVRNYIRGKKQKTEFEVSFLKVYEMFAEQAAEAVRLLHSSGIGEIVESAIREGDICHGNYTYHNLILTEDGIATVGFEKAGNDTQILDLYFFLRKVMEKNQWNSCYGHCILDIYREIRGMSREEEMLLLLLLAYPEKFWKIANGYYNSKKSWVPRRNMEKLECLLTQTEAKGCFLKSLQ